MKLKNGLIKKEGKSKMADIRTYKLDGKFNKVIHDLNENAYHLRKSNISKGYINFTPIKGGQIIGDFKKKELITININPETKRGLLKIIQNK